MLHYWYKVAKPDELEFLSYTYIITRGGSQINHVTENSGFPLWKYDFVAFKLIIRIFHKMNNFYCHSYFTWNQCWRFVKVKKTANSLLFKNFILIHFCNLSEVKSLKLISCRKTDCCWKILHLTHCNQLKPLFAIKLKENIWWRAFNFIT